MTGQPPKEGARTTAEATARETARKAHDMAEDVLQMSAVSVVSRSKATVLKLEARSLAASLDKKKSHESTEDAALAQQLLKDVARLRHAQEAKRKTTETLVKKKVTLLDALKEVKRPTDEPGSPEDVGIRDESVKDEESRALLRRASTFAPITGPAVEMPDEDIVAIVAQKLEEKSRSSPASHRSPTLSVESIGRRAEAKVLAATGRQPPLTSKPTSPAMSKKPSPTSSRRATQDTLKRTSPAASMRSSRASSKNPSPVSSRDFPMSLPAGSPWASKCNSPVASRQLSPVPSVMNIELVRDQRTKAHTSMERDDRRSSRLPNITPSMLREKEELDNVIKDLLKSADAGVGEENHASPYTSYAEGLIATLLGSDTRSAESDNFYGTLRRKARRNPLQLCVRICCSLALLAVAVVVVVVTLVYGNRAFAKPNTGVGFKVQASEPNNTGAQGVEQQLHDQRRQRDDVESYGAGRNSTVGASQVFTESRTRLQKHLTAMKYWTYGDGRTRRDAKTRQPVLILPEIDSADLFGK